LYVTAIFRHYYQTWSNFKQRSAAERGGRSDDRPGIDVERTAARAAEPSAAAAGDLPLNLEAAENLLIRRALAETGGNIAEAARRLGINRARIYRKLGEINQAPTSSPAPAVTAPPE